MVCGIGCTGRVAGYINIDSFHTTHGRALPFATGLHLARPDLNITVISGDGDLFAIGGNHFIHSARRNVSMLVIGVNNQIYGMTGGQMALSTPLDARTSTSPYGNYEHPFNFSALAAAAGATYVARWTSVDVRRLTDSIKEARERTGFRFIEVIAPCPTSYGRMNKLGDAVKMDEDLIAGSVIRHGTHPSDTNIIEGKPIILGKFKDEPKETYYETVSLLNAKVLGG